jgi:putative SbcD/Mre11-related phosphoesterase
MLVHKHWLLTPHRVAVHLPTRTAVIGDLHLGYDLARRRNGEAVPHIGLDDTVGALQAFLADHPVQRLVIAGDLVENRAGLEAALDLAAWLDLAGVELAGIVPGNHDRDLKLLGNRLPLRPDGVSVGTWRVVHGDVPLTDEPFVLGHHHPCFRWAGRVAGSCYLVGLHRLVLPAFSAEAGGVSVLHDPRWRRFRCCVIAGDEVLDFGVLGGLAASLQEKAGEW